MEGQKKIAMVIWVDDKPVTGSVIALKQIQEPRKDVSAYEQDDSVKASCRGFPGLHSCILCRIGDECNRKDFESFLKSDENFQDLVKEFLSPQTETSNGEEERKKTVKTPMTAVKRKLHQKTPQTKKQKDRNLEEIAESLELTELSQATTVTLDNGIDKNDNIISVIGDSLQMVTQEDDVSNATWQKANMNTCCCGHDQRIAFLERDLSQKSLKIQALESYLDSLWNWTRKLHEKVFEEKQQQQCQQQQQYQQQQQQQQGQQQQQQQCQPQQHQHQHQQQHVQDSLPLFCSPQRQAPSNSAADNSLHVPSEEKTYKGYTKAQLVSKITGMSEYSKAAKFLFRCLYTEEEIRGRSLTGAKANGKYEARPCLEDQTKLEIIYEIIAEKYGQGAVSVRDKLRDVMKPSRSVNGKK